MVLEVPAPGVYGWQYEGAYGSQKLQAPVLYCDVPKQNPGALSAAALPTGKV
jgi:hypothetical protein